MGLDLEFYNHIGDLIGTDHFGLSYVVVNDEFLNSIDDFQVNPLTQDSSIIHTGNSIYIEFEKVKKRLDPLSHYSQGQFDRTSNIHSLLDSIWKQDVLSIPGSGSFGLDGLNSCAFSFGLNGSSGNYFYYDKKDGASAAFVMLSNGTLVHELFHMYQGDFFYHEVGVNRESVFFGAGGFSHNPVQFFGQSGFGRTAPISEDYPNLFPGHLVHLNPDLEGRLAVTMTEACHPADLNLVDGISEGVHSDFEVFTMDLMNVEELEDSLSFGFNPHGHRNEVNSSPGHLTILPQCQRRQCFTIEMSGMVAMEVFSRTTTTLNPRPF